MAGWPRSGTTILGMTLGQVPGVFHAGELRHIWRTGLRDNTLCGCGLPFESCQLWGESFSRAYGGIDNPEAARLERFEHWPRTRHFPLFLVPGRRRLTRRYMGPDLRNLEDLYRAIFEVTGAQLLVDSSKSPAYARVLRMIPDIDLHVVHIVRDPRAVAHSWRKKKAAIGRAGRMAMKPPWQTALYWTLWNAATERMLRDRHSGYHRVRYEDFVDDPQAVIEGVLGFAGHEARTGFLADGSIGASNHVVAGNPVRFSSGDLQLSRDESFLEVMSDRDLAMVEWLTAPVRRRYGYG